MNHVTIWNISISAYNAGHVVSWYIMRAYRAPQNLLTISRCKDKIWVTCLSRVPLTQKKHGVFWKIHVGPSSSVKIQTAINSQIWVRQLKGPERYAIVAALTLSTWNIFRIQKGDVPISNDELSSTSFSIVLFVLIESLVCLVSFSRVLYSTAEETCEYQCSFR